MGGGSRAWPVERIANARCSKFNGTADYGGRWADPACFIGFFFILCDPRVGTLFFSAIQWTRFSGRLQSHRGEVCNATRGRVPFTSPLPPSAFYWLKFTAQHHGDALSEDSGNLEVGLSWLLQLPHPPRPHPLLGVCNHPSLDS